MDAAVATVLADLEAEEEELAALLASLTPDEWQRATPAAGWAVRDQVAHLAEGEELAAIALTDEPAFAAHLGVLLADLDAAMAAMAQRAAAGTPAEVAARWDEARRRVLDALRAVPDGARIPWVSGLMSVRSFATARLMETWAHGQDVCDALGRERPATARLRHVAHLGVATRPFSFTNRGRPVPDPPRVELRSPDDDRWTWGPEGAPERLAGDALDFCLVVTQRRHPSDSGLVAHGPGVTEWLAIAQCFAGPPTDGPAPRR